MKRHYIDEHEPIHHYFGLTYSAYQVMPRSLMQSMPIAWQKKMVRLLHEANDAFEHLPDLPSGYAVQVRNSKGRIRRG